MLVALAHADEVGGQAGPLGPGAEVTRILVAADPDRSARLRAGVLGAELYRAYGGTSVVLRLAGTWVLLVSGGGPTADKPAVTFAPRRTRRLHRNAQGARGRRFRRRSTSLPAPFRLMTERGRDCLT